MKKRLVAIACCVALVLSCGALVACGGGASSAAGSASASSASASAASSAASSSASAASGATASNAAASSASAADNAYVGTWKAIKTVFRGEEAPAEEVFENGDFILVLNADGTAEIAAEGEKSTANWSETQNGIKLKGDDINVEATNADGLLEMEVIGVHMFFEKQA